jgi:hypothetical protein
MKTEGRLMAVGAFRHFLPILRPEIPKHKVRALRGEIGKAVDPAVLANPVSGVHVIGVRLLGEPRPNGSFGGEEALLGLGDIMEPVGQILCKVPPLHNPLTLLGDYARKGESWRTLSEPFSPFESKLV